jgi:hypothetical protein
LRDIPGKPPPGELRENWITFLETAMTTSSSLANHESPLAGRPSALIVTGTGYVLGGLAGLLLSGGVVTGLAPIAGMVGIECDVKLALAIAVVSALAVVRGAMQLVGAVGSRTTLRNLSRVFAGLAFLELVPLLGLWWSAAGGSVSVLGAAVPEPHLIVGAAMFSLTLGVAAVALIYEPAVQAAKCEVKHE